MKILNGCWGSFVCCFLPVGASRTAGHRELDELSAVLRLEARGHELDQVVPAFLPTSFGNAEDQLVMDLGLDRPQDVQRHSQEGVADDLPGAGLAHERRGLGELPAL